MAGWQDLAGLACWICVTRVIESVLNYYSNLRACLSVELPVRRHAGKPTAVRLSVNGNEKCRPNGFLRASVCRAGRTKINVLPCVRGRHQTARWIGTVQ